MKIKFEITSVWVETRMYKAGKINVCVELMLLTWIYNTKYIKTILFLFSNKILDINIFQHNWHCCLQTHSSSALWFPSCCFNLFKFMITVSDSTHDPPSSRQTCKFNGLIYLLFSLQVGIHRGNPIHTPRKMEKQSPK